MICADGPVDFLRSRALIVKREGRRLQHELARVRVTQLYIYSSKRSVTAIRSAQARASGSVCGVLSGVIERAKTHREIPEPAYQPVPTKSGSLRSREASRVASSSTHEAVDTRLVDREAVAGAFFRDQGDPGG